LNYVNLPINFAGQKIASSTPSLNQALAGLNNLNNVAYTAAAQANTTTCNLNNTLFVGNLHASLQEIDLIQVFRPFGRIVECCKKWLHFGFVKFTTEDEACHAYVTLNGFRLKGRPMRLEFQNRTKKARIKAILAQAALQATTGNFQLGNEATLAYPNSVYDESQQASLNQSSKLNNGFFQSAGGANMTSSNPLTHNPNEFNSFYTKSSSESSASTMSQATPAPNSLDNHFFNPDQLIKFANSVDESKDFTSCLNFDFIDSNFCDFKESDRLFLNDFKESQISCKDQKLSNSSEEIIVTLTKKTLSPSHSPTHDSLSVSSDSGCRSASFLNDEDSAIASLKSVEFTHYHLQSQSSSDKMTNQNADLKLDECTISEQINFTCSNSSPVKEEINLNVSINEEDEDEEDECNTSCDTSDDASEIPTDSDCLNDLDLIDENLDICNDFVELSRFNQVMEKDGSIVRKKLDYGIYKSVNQTLSLFIEPHDVLKQLEPSEYDEYVLFPNEVDPYLVIDQNQFYLY